MNFWDKLLRIDRRWIFLCIALSVLIPFLTNLKLLRGTPTPATVDVYDYIQKLPPRSVLMLAYDYGPAGMPEMHPMAKAITRQAFKRKLRVVAVTIHPQGPLMADDVFASVAPEFGARYGVDYANLGYKPGGASVIMGMGSDIRSTYPQDSRGTPLGTLTVMKGVRNFDQVALLIDLATGSTPGAWVAYAHQRYHVRMAIGITAVMATDFYPYYQTGQLVGILNGMRGAADYETLIGREDTGTLGMSSQSVAHLVIILFVILGNIGYFASRRARAR